MFNVLVMLSLLVAAQDYPLDKEMTSSFRGQCSVEMTCKVTKAGSTYTYMYSVKNKGEKTIKFKWDIISQAMYFGHNIELMIDLEPGENAVFTLLHPDPPVQSYGLATAFYLTTNEKLEKLVAQTPQILKGVKIEISKKTIYNSESGNGHGALPKSYTSSYRSR